MCFHWKRLKPYDHQCVRCFQPGQPIHCCVLPFALRCICVRCNGKSSDWNTLNCLRASCTNTSNSRLLEIERASDNSSDQCSVVSCTSFIQQRTIRFSIVVIILILIWNERETKKNKQFNFLCEQICVFENICYSLWTATKLTIKDVQRIKVNLRLRTEQIFIE